jgi:haloalkane dehalogenase
MQATTTQVQTITLDDGMTLAYRELGVGPPVLLLHGWPTSSFLWRDVMPAIARTNCVVALDLPGFGDSDKPVTRYSFDFYERALDGFLDRLEMDPVGLAGHDIGGPIAVHWALRNRDRVTGIALLNTLLYPEFAPGIVEFVTQLSNPATRDELTSPDALADFIKLGLHDQTRLTDEVREQVQRPFRTAGARLALAGAGIGLGRRGFIEIARELPSLDLPARIVYGERDQVLPDIADTVARLANDLPKAEVTALDCGHFLQEEAPERVGELLAAFFAGLR